MSAATGKDHARINLGIWGDDDFRALAPAEQHLYFVLWTNAGLSYCGAGDWHPGRLSQLAGGWTADAIERAACGLERNLFLIVDRTTDEYLLRSWIKHDGLWRTPNMAVSVANARAALASKSLRGVVVHEVMKIRARHEDSGSWKRDAVVSMLEQNAIDPAEIEQSNPFAKGAANPSPKGGSNPTSNPYAHSGSNPTSNPGPTPAPSPTPSPSGGYVSREVTTGAREEPPLPNRCTAHAHDENPPACGACRDARLRAEAVEQTAKERAAIERRRQLDDIAEQTVAAIEDCDLCDKRGYRGTRVCTHDPDEDDRRRRGLDLVRQAITKPDQETA